MGVILHAFPSFHGINGRSLALAFIIVVHGAFLWALSSGLRPPTLAQWRESTVIPIEERTRPDEQPPKPPETVAVSPVVPIVDGVPVVDYDGSGWTVAVPPKASGGDPVIPTKESVAPVIVAPQIDTRHGLREPVYPPQEIRLDHTGTVLLAVEVLANGRVGGIRVVQSSGFPRLDDAAMKAAREWRLVPGTRDGVATAMWKQIPITFRLQN
ncbi:MAG: energy transducer TonB [Steroidobacteraceae bacterium]